MFNREIHEIRERDFDGEGFLSLIPLGVFRLFRGSPSSTLRGGLLRLSRELCL